MTLSKALLAMMTVGTLAISMPVFAAGINQSTGQQGGGGGSNPLSSNRGSDMGGVNSNLSPNSSTGCFTQDSQGQEIAVACPSDGTIEQSEPVEQAPNQPY